MSREYLALLEFPRESNSELVGYSLVSYSSEGGILHFRLKQLARHVAIDSYSDDAVVSIFDTTPLSFSVSPERFVRYISNNSDVLDKKEFRALSVILKQCYQLGYDLDFLRLTSVLEEKGSYEQWKTILRLLSRGDDTFEEWGVTYGSA